MSDLRLYSVNWLDGMLISQKHLKDQETYFEELVKWHAQSISDCYGLVKKSHSGKPSLSLNLSVSGKRLRVEVVRCQAITPDGTYIEINESNQAMVVGENTFTEPFIPIYLGIDYSSKKQIGDPDPGEDLPRNPYLLNSYVLGIVNPPNLPAGQFIQIAGVVVEEGHVRLAENYFPPCVSIAADDRLAQKTSDFKNNLEHLLSLSSRAYKAVTAGGALSGEKTALQEAFKDTVYQFAIRLASSMDNLVIGRNSLHPLDFIIEYKKIFRVITTILNLKPGLKDFLNEKFFTRQTESNVDRFIQSVESFLVSEYDHKNIGSHLVAIDAILGTLRGLMGFFAESKSEDLGEYATPEDSLTYQGRTYKLFTYSSNRVEKVGELCYLMIEMSEPRPVADTVTLIAKDRFQESQWRNMQVRLGINDARGLGETDPVEVDTKTFNNKVALRPQDMLRSSSVRQITLIFRGAGGAESFKNLGKMDLMIYSV